MKTIKLPTKYKKQVIHLLEKHIPHVEVWAYGSRVTGDCHSASDLDLVLLTPDRTQIPFETFNHLKTAFTNSNIPFLVELRDWAFLPESFKKEIQLNYIVLKKA